MESPFLIRSTVAASGKARTSPILLHSTRTVSVSLRATHHASATAGMVVNIYYSPDGSYFDTQAYGVLTQNVDAGNTAQASANVDLPEHGYVVFEVENKDTGQAATDIKLWYSIQSWARKGVIERGGEIDNPPRKIR